MRVLLLISSLFVLTTQASGQTDDFKKKLPGEGTVQWRVLRWQKDIWKLVDVEVDKDAVIFLLKQDLAISTPVDNLNLKLKREEYTFRDARGTILGKGMLDYDFGGATGIRAGSEIRATLKLPEESIWKKTKIVVVGSGGK